MDKLELYIITGLVSVIAYFLKGLHADIQGIRQNLQHIEKEIAVKHQADEDRDRRLENVEKIVHKE
jgi:hypothetical protein